MNVANGGQYIDETPYTVAEVSGPDTPWTCGCGAAGESLSTLAAIGKCALQPGEPSPAGRCPSSDALTYPDDSADPDGAAAAGAKFAPEHFFYTRDEWRDDVNANNTMLGYWAWVAHNVEAVRSRYTLAEYVAELNRIEATNEPGSEATEPRHWTENLAASYRDQGLPPELAIKQLDEEHGAELVFEVAAS